MATTPVVRQLAGDFRFWEITESGRVPVNPDPDDPQAWAAKVERLARDSVLRRAQIEKGKIRARDFSWRRIATCYLELMAEVDRENRQEGRPGGITP